MKNKILISIAWLVTLFTLHAQNSQEAWKMSKQIEKQIKRTSFAKKTYNILDFGAQAAENKLCHAAINSAILACNQAGGGVVIVPKGTFYTGPITLKSNVNLHLQEGAVLKFSTDQALYLPAVLTRWEGLDCYNFRPLIYAYGETNIGITGKGVIDGQASNENWWYMCGSSAYGWKEGKISQRITGRPRLLALAESFAPIDQRIMSAEDGLRPQLINLVHCNTLLIEGVTLTNSPFWVIHPLFCKNLVVSGVKIISHGPNSDGCDPESSSNVLIENTLFDTGDDCIAIKSGRNADGRKWNIASENMIVRGCEMKDGHGGVVVGSEISGGFKNLFVENCSMDSPNLDRVIRIKTNTCRGGVIENIFVRNITVGVCKEAVLKINLQYENKELCDRSFPPIVQNVHLENVTCQGSQYGALIVGLKESVNVKNILITNSTFNNVSKGKNQVEGAEGVVFTNVKINGKIETK